VGVPAHAFSALNAVRLPKFEPVIVVAEKDHGKRFMATFRAGLILRRTGKNVCVVLSIWKLITKYTCFGANLAEAF